MGVCQNYRLPLKESILLICTYGQTAVNSESDKLTFRSKGSLHDYLGCFYKSSAIISTSIPFLISTYIEIIAFRKNITYSLNRPSRMKV